MNTDPYFADIIKKMNVGDIAIGEVIDIRANTYTITKTTILNKNWLKGDFFKEEIVEHLPYDKTTKSSRISLLKKYLPNYNFNNYEQ